METSTVTITSNLYPLENPKEEIRFDNKFLQSITDFNAIEEMYKNNLKLTKLQNLIYAASSIHCVYADPGDFPNGTVLEEQSGQQFPHNTCKCHKMKNGACDPNYCRRRFH